MYSPRRSGLAKNARPLLMRVSCSMKSEHPALLEHERVDGDALARLRRTGWERRVVVACSLTILVVGIFLIVERTFRT